MSLSIYLNDLKQNPDTTTNVNQNGYNILQNHYITRLILAEITVKGATEKILKINKCHEL